MKMWSGRFQSALNEQADAFQRSLPVDKRLYKHDIMGSIAHATMLGECGIIEPSEAEAICAALSDIFYDIKNGKLRIADAEDIHMFIEEALTDRLGQVGKKLHTGRSRNDQVALDIRLYMRDAVSEIIARIKTLCETLCDIAAQHTETFMPAYTHMQKAQPTTLAHHLTAYCEMFLRDAERFADCRKRINVMPLGSGACTSTSYPINRNRVAQLLDFPRITQNSLDGVSDRDFAVEFAAACSLLMMHLSRCNEEIIYWATDEFGFITLSDAFSTGSSIMPQKKNPDMNELIRGKTGRVYGDLVALLTLMKGLPLAYNKDMQEDKEAIFDCEDTVKQCLEVFTDLLPSLTFHADVMAKGAAGGYTAATDCADYLVKKGMPFRDAHRVVGQLVHYCVESGKSLEDLSVEEYQSFSDLFASDILKTVPIDRLVAARSATGGPAKKTVERHLQKLRKATAAL
ncbi:MAG: argininosuccinate lyase [Clostridia bacterium]|nr:argininosuccinate lyase [Clostridia bacterium]